MDNASKKPNYQLTYLNQAIRHALSTGAFHYMEKQPRYVEGVES